jgi:hypothetical protein
MPAGAPITSWWALILWGAFGYIFFEVVQVFRRPKLLKRYLNPEFSLTRLLMCLVAGGVTLAMNPATTVEALALGFLTPSLPHLMTIKLRKMLRSFPPYTKGIVTRAIKGVADRLERGA